MLGKITAVEHGTSERYWYGEKVNIRVPYRTRERQDKISGTVQYAEKAQIPSTVIAQRTIPRTVPTMVLTTP